MSARIAKFSKRALFSVLAVIGFYCIAILVGMIPVNSDFEETEDGVEIFVFSGAFHSDLILPIDNSIVDWRTRFKESDFKSSATWATHVAFGWGDKGFYINTPSWTDLKFSTAANALLMPSDTVMHVSKTSRPVVRDATHLDGDENTGRIVISKVQYESLVDFISQSFQKNDSGSLQPIAGESYGSADAFYQGAGSYHAFRTCNCWVGGGLASAGVKTGWFTPLPKTVFYHLPVSVQPSAHVESVRDN